MAPLPSVAAGLKVILRHTTGSDVDVVNRLFFTMNTTSAPTPSDLDAWCSAAKTAYDGRLPPMYHPNVVLTAIEAEDLSSSTSATGAFAASTAGTRTGGQLPAGTALVMSKQISRRYRGGKPRSYLNCGTDTDLQTPQTWTTAFTATILTHWEGFIADCEAIAVGAITGAESINIGYYHGFTNFLYPSGRYKAIPTVLTVPHIDTILGYKVNPNVASQRRRNQTP